MARAQQRFALMFLFGAVASFASAQVTRVESPSQTFDITRIDASNSAIVSGQPYSAEGVTAATQTLSDGTHIERRVNSKFYRDRMGRTRREQTILGLAVLIPSGNPQTVVTISDPVAGTVYSLNPSTREARRIAVFVGAADGPPPPPPPPLPPRRGGLVSPEGSAPVPRQDSLGTRTIEGVMATGIRTTTTIPVGRVGNDRPIEITDERWESPELKVLVLLRHHDPQTGDIEYRLTKINRSEPSVDLFRVPSNYTILPGGPSRQPTPALPNRSPAQPAQPK